MSLIDIKCANDHVSEVYRAAKDWPSTPMCPECGESTVQIHLPKRVQWTADPVVVFKSPDGSYRFPGDANGLSARNYEKQGFQRVEIRGAAEMRSFEARMNKQDYSRAQRRLEQHQQQREARESHHRSELHHRMRSMSAAGRAVARAVMDRNDRKPLPRAGDSGFHSEAYSFDSSNRMESRDEQGRRRRD